MRRIFPRWGGAASRQRLRFIPLHRVQYKIKNKGEYKKMAQTITLKDSHYRIIGFVEIKDNGDKVLKDEHYRVKGYYEMRSDLTKDEHYRVVGHGDILTSLL